MFKSQQFQSVHAAFKSRQNIIKQISGAAGFQALQMGISAAIGFLIVRNLSKESYAFFNLFITGSAALISCASISITSVYIPFANRVGLDSQRIRSTTVIFRRLSSPLVIVGIITALTFWLISGYRRDWLNIEFFLGMALALAGALVQFYYRFPESSYKVSGKPLLPFSISIKSEVLRLIIVGVIILAILPMMGKQRYGAILLIAAIVFTSSLSYYSLNRRFKTQELGPAEIKPEHRKLYWGMLRPLLFPAYFYQVSQFFRGWLIYLLSGTSVIAEAAAVGRLMALYALMDKTVDLIILPRLGSAANRGIFHKRLFLSFGVILTIGLSFVLSAWLFPTVWLWLLGGKYENLGGALIWAVAAAGTERLSGLLLFAQLARGQTKNQWWVPLSADMVYMTYVAIFGLSTAEKATTALFLGAATNLVAQLSIFIWRLRVAEQ